MNPTDISQVTGLIDTAARLVGVDVWDDPEWFQFYDLILEHAAGFGFEYLANGASRIVLSRPGASWVIKIPFSSISRDQALNEAAAWQALPRPLQRYTTTLDQVEPSGLWSSWERVEPATPKTRITPPAWVHTALSQQFDTSWYNWGRRGPTAVLLDMEPQDG